MPPIRSRDLRANIKAFGFENGVVHTLERFFDEFAGYRQNMRDMSELLSQCINEVEKMISVGEGMQGKLADMQRIMNQGNEHDQS